MYSRSQVLSRDLHQKPLSAMVIKNLVMANKKGKLAVKKSFTTSKSQFFWLILAVLFIWYIIIRPNYNINKLKNEGKEVKVRIYRKSGVGSKGTIRCFYNFEVEGQSYEGFYDNKNLNQWDSIDIIYHKKNPSLNQAKQFVMDF
jgi:hypothetical protein